MHASRRHLDEARRRQLAVRASVDPRTIEKALAAAAGEGEPPRGMAGERALAVLVAEGLIPGSGRTP